MLLINSGVIKAQVFQNQLEPDTMVVDTIGNEINWLQFPDFSLPFTVVYHGDAPLDSVLYPLKKGFSHVATPDWAYKDTIFPHQRVYTWTNVIVADGWAARTKQPWREIKSPWGNDIEGYRANWDKRLDSITKTWYKYTPPGEKGLDILVADVEWSFHDDDQILSIKDNPLVPGYYQNLSDSAFIAEYKEAMTGLYGEVLQLARDSLHPDVLLSSYADVPIRTMVGQIYYHDYDDYISDSIYVDYLMNDSTGFMSSNFYELQDLIAPCIYNFYNVETTYKGRQYLAYNLFQIEVNQAWSDKGQLVYCWLNYHPSVTNMEAIAPWMAEATAIFPFMNGVANLYPWKPVSYDTYEYFIYGLYRLSQFSDMFDGNQTYVIPLAAAYAFKAELPVWRGVVNNNKILVAAQNPFANATDTTLIPVSYDNWSDTIGLIGNETFLYRFDMDAEVGIDEIQADTPESFLLLQNYPNPFHSSTKIRFGIPAYGHVNITVYNMFGESITTLMDEDKQAGNYEVEFNATDLPDGIYFIKLNYANQNKSIKLVLSK